VEDSGGGENALLGEVERRGVGADVDERQVEREGERQGGGAWAGAGATARSRRYTGTRGRAWCDGRTASAAAGEHSHHRVFGLEAG